MPSKGNPNPHPNGRFKKGEVRNAQGRRAHDPAMQVIRNLSKKEFIDVANVVVKGNLTELKAVAKQPDVSVLKTMLARVCIKIIEKGDMHSLNILLDRLIGKVPQDITLGADLANPPQIIIRLPGNGREANLIA